MADYPQALSDAERENDLPAGLLARVMKIESGGNPNAVSPAGAKGAMQFMPATAAQYGVDVNDPVSSIKGAGKYIADLRKQYKGNLNAALAHYNGGAYNAEREMTGSTTANPQKVSAKNNEVNKKYVNSFSDILGMMQANSPQAQKQQQVNTTPLKPLERFTTEGEAPMPTQQETDALLQQAQAAGELPSTLPDPYAGTTQANANPANPQAAETRRKAMANQAAPKD